MSCQDTTKAYSCSSLLTMELSTRLLTCYSFPGLFYHCTCVFKLTREDKTGRQEKRDNDQQQDNTTCNTITGINSIDCLFMANRACTNLSSASRFSLFLDGRQFMRNLRSKMVI